VQIVETASLAEVEPPDYTYVHGLQKQVAGGRISSLQLESVIYAFEKVRMIVGLLVFLRIAKIVVLPGLWKLPLDARGCMLSLSYSCSHAPRKDKADGSSVLRSILRRAAHNVCHEILKITLLLQFENAPRLSNGSRQGYFIGRLKPHICLEIP
jgi:hypothetical protein